MTELPINTDGSIRTNDSGMLESDLQRFPSIVPDLQQLVVGNAKFGTVYADPPWPYSNTAARGAAEKHYRTMTMDAICAEPVRQLVAEQAHLHLWTTNAFLREAFDVSADRMFECVSLGCRHEEIRCPGESQ